MGSVDETQYRMMLMRLEANRHRNKLPEASAHPPVEDESELQREIIDYCEAQGWWVTWNRMDLASTARVGTPDLFCFLPKGRLLIIECKARREKLRPAQLGVQLKLETLGHTVYVVRSMDDFLSVLRDLNVIKPQ